MDHRHEVIIIGNGLGALAAAARLVELGRRDVALYATGYGGTPYIGAINFVLDDNPYGDTPDVYREDMLRAGYRIADRELLGDMCRATAHGYELLLRWGVEFARLDDGSPRLRHPSGATFPRSLCNTSRFIGDDIIEKFSRGLREKGVAIHTGRECVKLLCRDGKVGGVTLLAKDGSLENAYAHTVIAGWGGVGNLFGASTYPADIHGRTAAMAFQAGAAFVDMEFLEYEPFVLLHPPAAVGEPCPTTMLAEGARVLNARMERYILKFRPEGEGGTPKTTLNQAAWQEVRAGRGTEHGGSYLDMRAVPPETMKLYPYFRKRLRACNVDPATDLLEVGPMAHSISGGMRVGRDYQTAVPGLYGVGEAIGGFHGACRMAGNAASQAVLSGLLCAQSVAAHAPYGKPEGGMPVAFARDGEVYARFAPEVNRLAGNALGFVKNEADLAAAETGLLEMLASPALAGDDATGQKALAALMMVVASRNRRESRGAHIRSDYPETDSALERGISMRRLADGSIAFE